MRTITIQAVFVLIVAVFQIAAQRREVDLWPSGKIPGSIPKGSETEMPARQDGVRRITNVTTPTLKIYPSSRKNSPAVIVLPGGGYSYLSYSKEGTDIAEWLNANGITALVLKYRVPNVRESALADAQRAIRLARVNAKAWNIDPKRLGVMGFSAGGHTASRASTAFGNTSYQPVDPVDKQSARPDFAMLIYPAYLEKQGTIVPEVNLLAKIPPTLIVVAEDDRSYVLSSKVYAAELNKANVPNRLLLYASGGHGFGLRSEKEAKTWPDAALAWLREIKVWKKQK